MKRFLLALGLLAALCGTPRSFAAAFTSAGPITLPGIAADRRASPYPSAIVASGIPAGSITSVKVTLNNLTVPRPDDLEILLVSPWGAKLVILADAGGAGTPVSGINVTLDDAAAGLVPDAGPLVAGSFRPTCVDNLDNIATEFPGVPVADPGDTAAPSGSATFASVFGGSHDPNGTWNLYLVDDVSTAAGGSFGSWTLDITTSPVTVATTTTLATSLNPSLVGQSVTFTATVVRQSDLTPVTTGTVTFREGAFTLAANVAVNASGQAAFATSGLSEGDHSITADYNPATGFLASNAGVNQRVDNATVQTGNTFANPGGLTFATAFAGVASVYPSRVFVTGLAGSISKVTLTINGLTINRPDDLELLLVGPNGATFVVIGDAGGIGPGVAGISLTFDDAAASQVPDSTAPASGTYRPSSYSSSSFPGPAPAPPYSHAAPQGSATFANLFNGLNPNGTWSLYALDDATGDGGSISGGWSLTFTTSGDAPTTTTVASSPNPSVTGASATFTATVVQTSDGSPVTVGSISFREGTTFLAGPIALDAAGQASLATSALPEGGHVISADYGGTPGSFNLSTGTTLHSVENATVVSGNSFCNPGAISISATFPSLAAVYPSRVNVSGLTGPVTKVSLSLSGITIDRPDDLEVLLVSPSGENFVVLGDAGGTDPVSGVDLILDDAGANLVPDGGPLTSGTFRPTSVNSSPTFFPSPAPAGSHPQPAPFGTATFASVFNGIAPNGSWSLYLLDDAGGGGALIAGGWCLTVETDTVPITGTDSIFRDQNRSVKVPIAQVLSNDTNPGGPPPTFVSVAGTSANGAAVHVVGAWIQYEAVPGNNADDSFTYTITDGTTDVEGIVTVTVRRPEGPTLNLQVTLVGTDQRVDVSGIPGRTYQVQTTESLTPPVVWTDSGGAQTADAAGRVSYLDVAPPSPRFYRAIEP